jgi:hypothetical protein
MPTPAHRATVPTDRPTAAHPTRPADPLENPVDTHPDRRHDDLLDLDLDLRDAARDGIGVVDLSARMRPIGGRRSSRHTHTRLTAALARIQASSLAVHEAMAAAEQAPAGCGTTR